MTYTYIHIQTLRGTLLKTKLSMMHRGAGGLRVCTSETLLLFISSPAVGTGSVFRGSTHIQSTAKGLANEQRRGHDVASHLCWVITCS